MVHEHAIFEVRAEEAERFTQAFEQAKPLIATAAGFRSLRLERGIENPTHFLLLVEWDRLEDHTEGFRGSPAHKEMGQLMSGFTTTGPVVEHFTTVVET